jgi:hypothetical protein
MNVSLAFALLPLLFLGSPVYAQSPCSRDLLVGSSLVMIHSEDCLWAAEPRTSLRVCSCRDCVCQRSRRPRRFAALVETVTLMS